MVLIKLGWYKSLIDFGTELGFNIWDWSAVVISICSFIIAACSLSVAMKTLKSQRKTEQNTMPLMNEDIQLFLLNNSLRELYESFISMNALYAILEFTNYKVYPSKQFWNLVYLDTNNFHLELFYGDEKKFRKLYYLIYYIEKFNSDVADLQNCISMLKTPKDLKKETILHICEDIGDLLQLWIQVYFVSFGLTKSQTVALLEQNFLCCNNCTFNTIYNDDKDIIRFYIQNSPFEKHVDEILEVFEEKIKNLVVKYSLDYNQSSFKTNSWHYVDLLLLNVFYDHTSFAGYVVDTFPRTEKVKFVTSESIESELGDFVHESIHTQNIRRSHSWLFYLIDL